MSIPASFLCGAAIFLVSRYFLFSSIIITLVSLIWLIRSGRKKLLLFVAAGIVYALIRVHTHQDIQFPSNRQIEVKGSFLPKNSALQPSRNTQEFVVESAVDAETGEDIESADDLKIRLNTDDEFGPDETYDLLIQTGRDRSRLNPGSTGRLPIYAELLEIMDSTEKGSIFGDIFEKSRSSLHSYIMDRFSADTRDFIAAVTIGEVHLGEDLKDAFNITGLAHILSISGTHFGLLSFVIFSITVFLISRLPYSAYHRLSIHAGTRQIAALICLPLMIFYLGLSGGSIPAVRSFVMIGLFLFGLLISRRGHWLNSVMLAAFLLLLWSPDVLMSLTFQLSFIAVLFIGYSVEQKNGDEASPEKDAKKSRIRRYIIGPVKLTLAAALGTAPLVAYNFHYLSIISPVANLIAAPLIGFVVLPLALISSFSYLLTGYYIFAPLVGAATDLSLWIVRLLARIPVADMRIPSFPPVLLLLFYGGFLLYLFRGRDRRLLVLPLLPFLIYITMTNFVRHDMSVTFLDVGQGDSAVVQLPDDRVIVIDSGRTGREAANFLKVLGRRTVDAVVLTHPHPDHIGGTGHIMRQFRVKELWDNSRIDYTGGFAGSSVMRRLGRGDIITGSGYSISVLHPYPEFHTVQDNEFVEGNNESLVLKVTGRQKSFLFLGDVEEEAEDDLLNLGKWVKADVLKVPHHGGRTSAHEGLIAEISPEIAVISVGRENSFGHPSEDMLETLSGRHIYRTDIDGAVRITETKEGLKVKTYRDFIFDPSGSPAAERKNIGLLFSVW